MSKTRIVLSLTAIFFMVALRVISIQNDPPHSLNLWSAYEFTDEGYKILAARNRTLFGNWKWFKDDTYSHWLVGSPLGVRLYYAVFSAFGFGIAQARLLNCFFGMLTILFFFLFAYNANGVNTACLATAILGFNFQFIMYNRLALWESFLVFFIVLSIFFYSIKSTKFGNKKYLGCVLSIACAYMIKPSIMIFLFSIIPGLIVYYWEKIKVLYSKLSISNVCAGVFFAVSVAFIMMGQIKTITNLILGKLTTLSLKHLFTRYIVEHFVRQPIILSLLLLYVCVYLTNYRKNREEAPGDIVIISWVFLSYFMLTSLEFNPIRYYIFILPAECYLAAKGVFTIASGISVLNKDFFHKNKIQLIAMAFFVISTIFAGLIQTTVAWGNLSFGAEPGMSYRSVALLSSLASVCLVAILYFKIVSIKNLELEKHNFKKYAVIICSLVFIVNLGQYLNWYIHSEPIIFNYSKELGEIAKGEIVGGRDMPVFCIANKLKCIKFDIEVNDNDELLKVKPAYILFNENFRFKKIFDVKFPKIMKNAKLIRSYSYGSGIFAVKNINLYKMNYDSLLKTN